MKFHKSKYLFIPVAAFLFFGGIPVEFGTEGAFFHGFMIPKPVITIGLGTNLPDIRIRSSSGMKIYEVDTGYKLIADDADEVQIKGGRKRSPRSTSSSWPTPRRGKRRTSWPPASRARSAATSTSPKTPKPTPPASSRSNSAIF